MLVTCESPSYVIVCQLKNREEWERRGESVVATLVEKVRRKEETTAMQ